MKQFEPGNLGKTIVIELERGDKVIEGIEAELKTAGIKNAFVASAVGSIQKLIYHRPTTLGASSTDEFVTVESPMEFGSLTGSVFDGIGHLHFVSADRDNVYCGHLEYGTEVLYLLEVIMVEIVGCDLERKLTSENVKKLFVKGV